jgi:site-specific recombinase XerC
MPRKRSNPSMEWLPTRVYLHRKNWVYQPKSGGKVVLCPLTDEKPEVLRRYEQEVRRLESNLIFEDLIDDFYNSDTFQKLSFRTRKDYGSYSQSLVCAFGNMHPHLIEPHHVRYFMDELAKDRGANGQPANSTANRHKACLQKICRWALQRGKMKVNPCVGVDKCEVKRRERYITDTEYLTIYNAASHPCKVAMEISYLSMVSIADVMSIKLSDMLEDGLCVGHGKTGKKQITPWSERLREAVKMAQRLPLKKGKLVIFLISKPDGSKYSLGAIQKLYKAACQNVCITDITFQDINSKSKDDQFLNKAAIQKLRISNKNTVIETSSYEEKVLSKLKYLGCDSSSLLGNTQKLKFPVITPDGNNLENLKQSESWIMKPWTLSGSTPLDWFESQFHRWNKTDDQIRNHKIVDWQNESQGGVYFLFYKSELVYIGKAICLSDRLYTHYHSDKVFDEISFIKGIPDYFLEDVEMFYIHKYKPSLNLKYLPVSEVLAKYLEEY